MREGGSKTMPSESGGSNKKEMRGTVRSYLQPQARCGKTAHRCASRIARECAAES